MNASIRTRRFALAAAALGLGLESAAHAAGFYLQEQSARAVGRAFSGEAADTVPDSLWWNPSAIGGAAERSAYFGLAVVSPSGDVSDTGTLILRPGQAPAGQGHHQLRLSRRADHGRRPSQRRRQRHVRGNIGG